MIEIAAEFFSTKDYINNYNQSGDIKKRSIANCLKSSLEIIPFLNRIYPDMKAEMEIRIQDCEDKVAESSPYSIIVSTGTIAHCIAAPCIPVEEISAAMHALEFDYNSLASLSLAWIISHEYFHIARKHNEVAIAARELENPPYDNSIDNALEHDADLLAMAAIYRLMQHKLSSNLHDMDIRRLTAYHIFFSLRTFKQGSNENIHSPMPERLFHLAQKLIQVVSHPREKVSASGLTEHSKERVEAVYSAFIECEKYFNLTNGRKSEFIELFRYINEKSNVLRISSSWEWISPLVEKITNTKANNQKETQVKNFLTCVFCNSRKSTVIPIIAPWIVEKLDIKPGSQILSNAAVGVEVDDGSIFSLPILPYIRESKIGKENIQRICIACATNWLKPLENSLKPIIDRMIDGNFLDISQKDSKKIALYICILTVLHEYTDPEPINRIIPPHSKFLLRRNIIPENWSVTIRKIEYEKDCRIRHHHCGINGSPVHVIFNLKLGSFFAQLVAQINNTYPLYFGNKKHFLAYPYRKTPGLADIQETSLAELPEAYDKLHGLMHIWWLTIMYKHLRN